MPNLKSSGKEGLLGADDGPAVALPLTPTAASLLGLSGAGRNQEGMPAPRLSTCAPSLATAPSLPVLKLDLRTAPAAAVAPRASVSPAGLAGSCVWAGSGSRSP